MLLDVWDCDSEVKESAKKLGREMIDMGIVDFFNQCMEEREQKALKELEKRTLDAQMMSGWSKNKHLLFK